VETSSYFLAYFTAKICKSMSTTFPLPPPTKWTYHH
jgi:hypothetical protein